MLRRRHKTPKSAPQAPREGGTARTLRSRRRAREDAPVPPDLKIQSQHGNVRSEGKPAPKPPPPQPKPVAEAKPQAKPVEAKPHPKPGPEPKAHPKPAAQARPAPEAKPQPKPAAQAKPQPKPVPQKPDAPERHERGAHSAEGVVLVTGFEPFGGDATNPSWEVCTRLPREIAGLRVEVCRVPCEFRRAIEVVAAAIERHQPTLVVSLGLAAGRTHMGVERVAINVDDARIPDNAGVQPIDQPIAANGPPAHFATLPVKAMVAAMHERGVPAEVSNTAGTFVCNHLMYGVLHYIAAKGTPARAGFIHMPCSEEMALARRDAPTMSLATMVRGVEAAIAAAHTHAEDIAAAGGSLD
jgi:pyroglutamyl-peptidase